jgi:hypothetical protein
LHLAPNSCPTFDLAPDLDKKWRTVRREDIKEWRNWSRRKGGRSRECTCCRHQPWVGARPPLPRTARSVTGRGLEGSMTRRRPWWSDLYSPWGEEEVGGQYAATNATTSTDQSRSIMRRRLDRSTMKRGLVGFAHHV